MHLGEAVICEMFDVIFLFILWLKHQHFPYSLMSGLSAMDTKASGRLGLLTITYYLWTTFIAVIVGIILVLIIHPGTGTEKEGHKASGGPVMTSADALLDLIR